MSKGLIDLISILDLEQIEVNLSRGNSPKTSWQRWFGGQVIGQAMVAACRTVEGRLPHSIHCYFILPGDPQIPIIYQVERLRDGKSYSTRRVTAIQHGNAIFSIMVSFHAEEESAFDHQEKMPDVPPPEKLTAEEAAKQPMFSVMPASLDHAMWFHRPFRADEWLLYSQDSPSAQGGRGLTRGLIFKPDGTLVASVAQEGSVRERKV